MPTKRPITTAPAIGWVGKLSFVARHWLADVCEGTHPEIRGTDFRIGGNIKPGLSVASFDDLIGPGEDRLRRKAIPWLSAAAAFAS